MGRLLTLSTCDTVDQEKRLADNHLRLMTHSVNQTGLCSFQELFAFHDVAFRLISGLDFFQTCVVYMFEI